MRSGWQIQRTAALRVTSSMSSSSSGTAYHHNGGWITGDGRGYNGAIIRLPSGTEAVVLIDTDGFDTVGTMIEGFNRMQTY